MYNRCHAVDLILPVNKVHLKLYELLATESKTCINMKLRHYSKQSMNQLEGKEDARTRDQRAIRHITAVVKTYSFASGGH